MKVLLVIVGLETLARFQDCLLFSVPLGFEPLGGDAELLLYEVHCYWVNF